MLIIEVTDIRIPEENVPISKISTSGKAAIISRMAKMGQSILPKMAIPSTTDSEDTEVFIFTFLFCNAQFFVTLTLHIYFSSIIYNILSPNLKEIILFCRMMYLINLLVRKRFVTICNFFYESTNLCTSYKNIAYSIR